MNNKPKICPPRHRFTLRASFTFVLLICVLSGVISAVDQSTTHGLATFGLAIRLLGILVAAAAVALFSASVVNSLLAALYGVVLADMTYLSFGVALGGFRWLIPNATAGFDEVSIVWKSFVNNPLLVIGLLACAAAAMRGRALALTIGLSLALVLPAMIATWMIGNMSRGPGSGGGIGGFFWMFFAITAMAMGTIGTLTARVFVEILQRLAKRRQAQHGQGGD